MNAWVPAWGRRRARQAAGSPVMEAAARWGLAARGSLYFMVGALALRIAFGDRGEQADRGGALEELSARPMGAPLVWALGIGLAGMAVWRLSEALVGASGPDGRKARKRLLSTARAAFYTFVAFSVLSFAAGVKASGSSDQQSRDVTSRALELPAGQWLVGLGGLAVAGAGVWIGGRAALRKYHKHLKRSSMSRRTRKAIDVLGVSGGVARGAVFALAGGFVMQAAVEYDPDEAKGFDDTLRAFADAPAGPWLLAAIAAGLALFGLFSFALARWRRV
ncbi:DUF1206 domain-containing protein [Streptomyces sp. NPDC051776]|uniref:DUF1206 domain-containing protein n=1 Tax=Streptomyces sp. NPDC051776 TaxID=3155414 RepID=UPI00342A7194